LRFDEAATSLPLGGKFQLGSGPADMCVHGGPVPSHGLETPQEQSFQEYDALPTMVIVCRLRVPISQSMNVRVYNDEHAGNISVSCMA
jgi:hypothetical protein